MEEIPDETRMTKHNEDRDDFRVDTPSDMPLESEQTFTYEEMKQAQDATDKKA